MRKPKSFPRESFITLGNFYNTRIVEIRFTLIKKVIRKLEYSYNSIISFLRYRMSVKRRIYRSHDTFYHGVYDTKDKRTEFS